MTPDELDRLADEATPGPWDWFGGYPQRITSPDATLVAQTWDSPDVRPTNAVLIALAPTLARQHAALLRWATDEVRDVLLTRRELHGYDCPGDPFCHACRVLAALDEIRKGGHQ